jgi:hypothetical protein
VNEQHGNRIALRSMSTRQRTGFVDYAVLVPTDAFVILRSSDRVLHVQGLRNDVVLQPTTAYISRRF